MWLDSSVESSNRNPDIGVDQLILVGGLVETTEGNHGPNWGEFQISLHYIFSRVDRIFVEALVQSTVARGNHWRLLLCSSGVQHFSR